jgi:hypothetical protein
MSNGESVANFATENPLLTISNGQRINPLLILQRKIRCLQLATNNPLLIISNGFSVAAKSATDLSVAKKSATTNLHPIFAVADFVAKLF